MALTQLRGNTQIQDLSISNAEIAIGAGILLSKIEDGALLVKSNGSIAFTSPVSGVTPVGASDLVTKGYVDAAATGVDVKPSVRAASTGNVDIAVAPTQIDTTALVAGDRVLLKNQTVASENGIYVWAAAGSPMTRATDADSAAEVTSGLFTFVEEGATNVSSGWILTTANPIALGTTDLQFAQFSSAGIVQAGAGLLKTGAMIDIVSTNGGIVVNPDSISLTLADTTLAIVAGGLKLATLPTANILIGDATGVASARTVSGDITIAANGVVTIGAGAVTNSKVAVGTLGLDKLVAGTAGQIIVANGTGVPTYVSMSGDATINTAGSLQLAANSVGTAELANQAVTLDKLPTLPVGNIIVGAGAGNTTVAVSGDVTISETGVVTINSATVVRVADIITREVPVGLADGTNPTFTLANVPKLGTEHVYLNGLLMDAGAGNDYTIAGAVITFTFNPGSGDKVRASYFK